MTRLLWSLSIFTLFFQLSQISLTQLFGNEFYLPVVEGEDPEVFEPDPQFLSFDLGSGSWSDTWSESETDFTHAGSRDLKGLTSVHPENGPQASLEKPPSTDELAWDSSSVDINKCLQIAQEYLDTYTKMIISRIPMGWQPEPTFSGLPWNAMLIIILINIIIFFTFLWSTVHALKTILSNVKDENDQQERTIQQLEEKVKMLEQGREALNNEKWQLEEHIKIFQQNLEQNKLCQENNNNGQQKLDSEHHESETQMKEALRIQKHTMQEIEQQHLKTEALLNTRIALEEKRVQENWINACVAERALDAERKETARLREQLMAANTKLAHIRSPVFLPATVSFDQQMTNFSKDGSAIQTSGSALDAPQSTTFSRVNDEVNLYKEKLQAAEKKNQELEEQIQTLECDRASLHSKKQYMQNQNKIMQEKLAIMDDLCQQKDKALQEKLAQEQLEQHEKDIRAAGPKEEIRAFKQRIQEIEGKHHKTEADLKSKIEFHKKQAEQNRISALLSERALLLERRETESLRKKLVEVSAKLAGHQGSFSEPTASCSAKQIPPARSGALKMPSQGGVDELAKTTLKALEKERESFMKKLMAEEFKVKQLQENISTLEQERATWIKGKCHLKMEIKSLQHKLDKMKEVSKQKDEALQKKAAQVESERREKEAKVKDVLKTHKQKMQTVKEERQKMELSYKAQVAAQKKKSQDNWSRACEAEKALAAERQETANLRKQLDELSALLAEFQRPDSESVTLTPSVLEEEQIQCTGKCLLRSRRANSWKIQNKSWHGTMPWNLHTLSDEKCQLEHQNTS